MPHELIEMITSVEAAVRNRSLDAFCGAADAAALHEACDALDGFRRTSDNLYQRVRALFLLSNIYRYHLPPKLPARSCDRIPYDGYQHLLQRRFDEALRVLLDVRQRAGDNDTIASALAAAYHQLGFQTLADQVRRSVRSVRGNQWMFRVGHPSDHPLRIRRELLARTTERERFPVLWERTPVRMDLSHSAWSDIFFLGMDFPEGARVLNVSVDLGVRGRDAEPRPPIEVFLRVIDEPVLRLASVDLRARADIRSLAEVFDFAKDYLGLLKAGLIAAGIGTPANLLDGVVSAYASQKCPCEWTIVLGKVYRLQEIRLHLYVPTTYSYHYGIATSSDGRKFVPLAERTSDRNAKFEQIRFEARPVVAIKVLGMASTRSKMFYATELEAHCIPPDVVAGR